MLMYLARSKSMILGILESPSPHTNQIMPGLNVTVCQAMLVKACDGVDQLVSTDGGN